MSALYSSDWFLDSEDLFFLLFGMFYQSVFFYICHQVAASRVQVLNSVNSKLPFLVTTADDAKDTVKEEIRLRY